MAEEILSGRAGESGTVTKGLGSLVNRILEPLGLRLGRARMLNEVLARHWPLLETEQRHTALVAEVEALLRETQFKDLPARAGRADLLRGLYGTTVTEAIYLLDNLYRTLTLDGDICEFGVAQGATSALVANEIRDTAKKLWLFDSFEGLPAPTEKDELIDDIFGLGTMANYQGQMACPVNMVTAKLNGIGFPAERTRIVPGFVPASFEKAELPTKVCFAYVDFDFYEPILLALRFLDPLMPAGARVVVDDYGFFSSGAKTAVDEFVLERAGAYELTLPLNSAGKFCILHKLR